MLDLYFLRHGETQGQLLSTSDQLPPDSENGLSEEGAKAARERAIEFANSVKLDRIISSSMLRARETAEIFAKAQEGAIEIELEDRLRERNPPEGQDNIELGEFTRLQLLSYESPHESVMGMESCLDHSDRVRNWMADFVEGAEVVQKSEASSTLIVSHGGTMEHILRSIFFADLDTMKSAFVTWDLLGFFKVRLVIQPNHVIWGVHGLNSKL